MSSKAAISNFKIFLETIFNQRFFVEVLLPFSSNDYNIAQKRKELFAQKKKKRTAVVQIVLHTLSLIQNLETDIQFWKKKKDFFLSLSLSLSITHFLSSQQEKEIT